MSILKCDFCQKLFYSIIIGVDGVNFKLKCPSCKSIQKLLDDLFYDESWGVWCFNNETYKKWEKRLNGSRK